MRSFIKSYSKYLVFLAVSLLFFMMQANAQFDDGGPPAFDPPPDNDVPLDTYQWVMMAAAVGYGIYIFMKNRKKKASAAVRPLLTA